MAQEFMWNPKEGRYIYIYIYILKRKKKGGNSTRDFRWDCVLGGQLPPHHQSLRWNYVFKKYDFNADG